MVGTSNGGTSIMSYTAQSLVDDLLAFIEGDKRPFESNSAHGTRTDAFANFPPLTVSPITLQYQLTHHPLGEHNLLDDDEPHRAELLERLDNLVDEYFQP